MGSISNDGAPTLARYMLYGVWHSEDREWIAFEASKNAALDMVHDYGDHLQAHVVEVIVPTEPPPPEVDDHG